VRCNLGVGEFTHDAPELLLFGRRIELHDGERSRDQYREAVEAGRECAVVRVDGQWLAASAPTAVVRASGADAFTALRRIADGGFWVGFLTYDLGRAIEHIETRTHDDLGLPDVVFARFDDLQPIALDELECEPVALGAGRSSLTPAEHEARVHAVQELLRAGECYQVNLTRRIAFDAAPDPVALFTALARANPAPHAGLLALDGLAVVSASPESFLRVDGRSVETRPIKGTAVDAAALLASAKDRAENVMIVDLARNDLGRVCEFGSIAVPDLMEIEEHPGLHHLVSTVTGTLRAGVRLDELVRATFPPASVTGAPKPRVLQAIEDLEPVRRGVYCGAFGWIDADRSRADLAVAIRTFTIAGPRTYLGVGGGIVADSVASLEWAETELKAARLLGAVGAYEAEPVAAQ
jgi:para-aminobenzoate synthetase component 1